MSANRFATGAQLAVAEVEADETWDLCSDGAPEVNEAEVLKRYDNPNPGTAEADREDPVRSKVLPGKLVHVRGDAGTTARRPASRGDEGAEEPAVPDPTPGSKGKGAVQQKDAKVASKLAFKRRLNDERSHSHPTALPVRTAASSSDPPAYSESESTEPFQIALKDLGFANPPSPDQLPRSLLLALQNRFTRADLARFREDAELNFTTSLPYFFAGSFVFPAALAAATPATTLKGIAKSMTPAVLKGFARRKVKDMGWPAMEELTGEAAKDVRVHGMLLFGMLPAQRKRIHAFEGGMFDLKRKNVEFELNDGEVMTIEAGVYVWNQGRERLDEGVWKIEDLLGSSWFKGVIRSAQEEEKALAGEEL